MPLPTPRVSIIVRSVGRPELAKALRSVAAQTYAAVEVVLVDATGSRRDYRRALELDPAHAQARARLLQLESSFQRSNP